MSSSLARKMPFSPNAAQDHRFACLIKGQREWGRAPGSKPKEADRMRSAYCLTENEEGKKDWITQGGEPEREERQQSK